MSSGARFPIPRLKVIYIDAKCKQLDIDVMSFINSGENSYESIQDVSKDTASKMLGLLNEYQTKNKSIPKEVEGYKPNWR